MNKLLVLALLALSCSSPVEPKYQLAHPTFETDYSYNQVSETLSFMILSDVPARNVEVHTLLLFRDTSVFEATYKIESLPAFEMNVKTYSLTKGDVFKSYVWVEDYEL